LYLDRNGKIVPPERREDAAVLFKPRGGDVSQAELERYAGQIERYIPELREKAKAKKQPEASEPEEATDEPAKATAPQANKKRTPKRNK
jgi:hypothetical protein